MAIRIDADADMLSTTSLPALQFPTSFGGWVYIVTDRNNFSTPFDMDAGAVDGFAVRAIQTDSDGTTMFFWGANDIGGDTFQSIRSMTVGQWYYFLIVNSSATASTVYHAAVGDVSLSSTDYTMANSNTFAPVNFRVGDSKGLNEWWNGRI